MNKQIPMTHQSRALLEHREQILVEAERCGIADVRVYGSMARAEAGAGSDVNLLVSLAPGNPGGVEVFGLMALVKEVTGRRVTMLFESQLRLKPGERKSAAKLREQILAEALPLASGPKQDKERLDWIAERIHYVRNWTVAGRSVLDDEMSGAVKQCLYELTDCTRYLSPYLQESEPDIPWAPISAFRDMLLGHHLHLGHDPDIIWSVIERNLPELEKAVERMTARTETLLRETTT